jgi:hypothetical protein
VILHLGSQPTNPTLDEEETILIQEPPSVGTPPNTQSEGGHALVVVPSNGEDVPPPDPLRTSVLLENADGIDPLQPLAGPDDALHSMMAIPSNHARPEPEGDIQQHFFWDGATEMISSSQARLSTPGLAGPNNRIMRSLTTDLWELESETTQTSPPKSSFPNISPEAIPHLHSLPEETLSVRTTSLFNPILGSEDEFWIDIQQFFETMFIVFPILSRENLISRLALQQGGIHDSDFHTVLLSIRLLNAASKLRMEPQRAPPILGLVRQVEQSRLCYEFSEQPTLDAVVVSLFLFTAYNVLGKHNRAFLYLDEAFSLMDMVEARAEDEIRRKSIIKRVLFNTEAASFAIYAVNGRGRRAPRLMLTSEELRMANDTLLDGDDDLSRIATHLLKQLTEVHSAEDWKVLTITNPGALIDPGVILDAVFQKNSYVRLQAADSAITRQWQLSSKLVYAAMTTTSRVEKYVNLESMGVEAMSWICLLGEGELRIVGLGKLAALARNIFTLTEPGRCQQVLGGLVGAVRRGDHERIFAPALLNVVMPMMGYPADDLHYLTQHDPLQPPYRREMTGIFDNGIIGLPDGLDSILSPADSLGGTPTITRNDGRVEEDQNEQGWDLLLQFS